MIVSFLPSSCMSTDRLEPTNDEQAHEAISERWRQQYALAQQERATLSPEIIKPIGEGFDGQGNILYDFREAPELKELREAISMLQCFNEDVHLVGSNPPRHSEGGTAGFILDTPENRKTFLKIAAEIDEIKRRLGEMELPVEKIVEEAEGD